MLSRIEAWVSGKAAINESPVITRVRHREGVEVALEKTAHAIEILEQDLGAELVAEEVRMASRALAGLVGEINVEDVLGAVFSEFCIGK